MRISFVFWDMAIDPLSALPVAVGLGKILTRHVWNADLAADLGDAKDFVQGLGAVGRHQEDARTPQLNAAIAAELARRLERDRGAGPSRREDVTVAAEQAGWVIDAVAADPAAVLAAATRPDTFTGYLRQHPTARSIRRDLSQAQEPVFDAVLAAAGATFCDLAPSSDAFQQAALIRVAVQVDDLRGTVEQVDHTTRQNLEVAQENLAVTQQIRATQTRAAGAPADPATWVPIRRIESVGRARHQLGVHAAITVEPAGTSVLSELPTYVTRPHDRTLRTELENAVAESRPLMAVLVGGSSTGKSRTMREAVVAVLPDAPVFIPAGQRELAATLETGLPAGCVVWLDELQTHLDHTAIGARVADAVTALLERGHSIVVLASVWPGVLHALQARPGLNESAGQAAHARAVESLLHSTKVTQINVPDDLSGADPAELDAAASADPRIGLALRTAGDPQRAIQVLAGGTALIARLHPDQPGNPAAFSPAAAAVLTAAGDLIRVGHPNRIPRSLLAAASHDYLTDPRLRRPGWVNGAVDEAAADSTADLEHTLDIAGRGVPALTTLWSEDGTEFLELHDYLLQDHLRRRYQEPTRRSLWNSVIEHGDQIDLRITCALQDAATARGLDTTAIQILERGDVAELTRRADTYDEYAQHRLADLLARRGDMAELTRRADTGDWDAQDRLADLLAERDVVELTRRADTGDWYAQDRLADLLAERDVVELTRRADTGDEYAQDRLADLLREDGNIVSLRAWTHAGVSTASRHLIALLSDGAEGAELDVDGNLVYPTEVGKS